MPQRNCCNCASCPRRDRPNRIVTLCNVLGDHLTNEEVSLAHELLTQTETAAKTTVTTHDVNKRSVTPLFPTNKETDVSYETNNKRIPTRLLQNTTGVDSNKSDDFSNPNRTTPCLDSPPTFVDLVKQLESPTLTQLNNDDDSFYINAKARWSKCSQTKSNQRLSRSFATDCKKRTSQICMSEVPKSNTYTNVDCLHRERKRVIHYTSRGYTASTSSTKFGSDSLLSLCSSEHEPNARMTFDGYREQLEDILRCLDRRDLLPMLQRTRPLVKDLVERYYMRPQTSADDEPAAKRVLRSATRPSEHPVANHTSRLTRSKTKKSKKEPYSCEVKMRVRIQYKSHAHLLNNIESIKNCHEERQLDRFCQATSIMRGRDTGCVVCNISFSDITYLGAFWRDYSNGALQEALRGVFLTEMMRQTAGDEELDLLVSVDEKDFLNGQKILVRNLEDGTSGNAFATGISIRGPMGEPRIEQA